MKPKIAVSLPAFHSSLFEIHYLFHAYYSWLFLAQKSARAGGRSFTSVSQVLVNPILRAVHLSRSFGKTLVKKSFVICEAKSDFA